MRMMVRVALVLLLLVGSVGAAQAPQLTRPTH